MELTNEEKLKVFAMYWDAMYCLSTDAKNVGFVRNILRSSRLKISNIKLLLASLTKITDEHAIQLAIMMDVHHNDFNLTKFKKELFKNSLYNAKYYVHQFLLTKGYAVPLFIGLNHPCNGQDAITLGIAIDKTTLHN